MMVNFLRVGRDTDLVRGGGGHLGGVGDEGHADALKELVAAHGRESEVEEDTGEHAHGDLAEDVLEEDDGGADEEVEDEGVQRVSVTPVTSSRPVAGPASRQ